MDVSQQTGTREPDASAPRAVACGSHASSHAGSEQTGCTSLIGYARTSL